MKKWYGSKWIRRAKRLAIYARDDFTCVYCGDDGLEVGFDLTLDHVVPREFGGGNKAANLVTACRSCNSSKKDLTTRRFFVLLRDRGVDTSRIARRIRRQTRRMLKK